MISETFDCLSGDGTCYYEIDVPDDEDEGVRRLGKDAEVGGPLDFDNAVAMEMADVAVMLRKLAKEPTDDSSAKRLRHRLSKEGLQPGGVIAVCQPCGHYWYVPRKP